jgi:hypothetical protein
VVRGLAVVVGEQGQRAGRGVINAIPFGEVIVVVVLRPLHRGIFVLMQIWSDATPFGKRSIIVAGAPLYEACRLRLSDLIPRTSAVPAVLRITSNHDGRPAIFRSGRCC